MPLTRGQIAALGVLAAARNPESYVAGSTPLNADEPRASRDIDIFHDSAESAARAAEHDAALLAKAGFAIQWQRRLGGVYSLIASRDGEDIKLEWVADSDFRFFPTIPDPLFGYMLHPVDLALNKAMAAATRHELRDIVDLVTIHNRVLPLGAVVWAAVEKSPGFTPEGLIAEIRRNSNYPLEEWRQLASETPIDPLATLAALRAALAEADIFLNRMPTEKIGLLFVDANGAVVQPDPDRLAEYTMHAGRRRGHWPEDETVTAAMIERLKPPA